MPWLTPENLPSSNLRRVILIPDDPVWLACFLGALLDMTLPTNWEEYGSQTPEAVANRWQDTFDAFIEGEVCPEPDP